MIIICAASAFGFYMSWERIPARGAEFLIALTQQPWLLLLLINVGLIVVGMLIEGTAALILLTPILVPAVTKLGIDPLHFGLVIVVNLTIGGVTPPVGTMMFTTCSIMRVKIETFVKEGWPLHAGDARGADADHLRARARRLAADAADGAQSTRRPMEISRRGPRTRSVRRSTIERVTLAPLAPGDVLVRNRASGLCHTDLEVIEGSLAYPMPIVLGHEGAGIVEAVGSAVTLVRAGRPCRLLVEPALRPLLLLRARPADPVRAVHARAAARQPARRHARG